MVTGHERLQQFLRGSGVEFVLQHHREVFTMQAVAAELHEKGAHVAKVVIAWADGKLVMLVLSTPAQVDFERVKQLLKADKVRAAHEDEFKSRFPDCDPGAMPPFGHLYQMPTYLEASLSRTSEMVFQAGTHRDTIKMVTADYVRLASPVIAGFIVQPYAEASGP